MVGDIVRGSAPDGKPGWTGALRLAPTRRARGASSLLAKVWGREYVDEVDDIRVYIRRLRDKLGDSSDAPRFIQTERGLGYRFIEPS